MKAIRFLVTGLATIAGICLFALAGLVAFGVAMRYGFNTPLIKANDWTQLLMLLVVGFGLAYCGLKHAHVEIDILTKFLSQRAQRILMIIINVLSGVLMLLVTWQSIRQGIDAADMAQVTNLAELPMAWFFMLGAVGIGTYAVVLLLQAVTGESGSGEHP